MASVTYPRCTHALCDVTSTGDPARTVGFTYDQGWLETVPGYGTLTLHPNGMVHQVDHLNGRRDVYPADPYGMARPSNVQVFNTGTGTLVTELGLHQYDPVGNLMTRGGDRYAYDLAGRLVRFQTSSGQYQTYGFDGFGNLTQVFKSDTGSTVTYATDATTNRLAMGSYDAAGNLLSMAPHSQTWDALDTLMQRGVQAETYLYTAADERVYVGVADTDRTLPRMASETWTLRDQGGEVLTVYTTNGTRTTGAWAWQKDYVYRGSTALAAVLPGNVVHHFTVDHLGTPRATWSSTGTLLGSQHYWGFGEHLGGNTADPETKRFTGHERDLRGAGTADDLDYMHARYYSPTWGRFLSVDPKARRGPSGTLALWNRYAYAANRPLVAVDPDGRDVMLVVRDSKLRPLSNFGHVALRVFGEGYDFTFDFGRYRGTRDKAKISGPGVLNVWSNFDAFMKTQQGKGKLRTARWTTSAEFDQEVLDFFKGKIKEGIAVEIDKDHFSLELAENYDLKQNNCTTICIQALVQADLMSDQDIIGLEDIADEYDPRDLYEELSSIFGAYHHFLPAE